MELAADWMCRCPSWGAGVVVVLRQVLDADAPLPAPVCQPQLGPLDGPQSHTPRPIHDLVDEDVVEVLVLADGRVLPLTRVKVSAECPTGV